MNIMNNEGKFLPIGTVCTVIGKNNKVMITGFFSVEYTGNIKMFDYKGCVYPEGLLLENKSYSFNHSDIEKVEYLGYITDDYRKFNDILNRQQAEKKDGYQTKEVLSNIKFDENGVVIYDPIQSSFPVKQKFEPPVPTTNNSSIGVKVDNPFIPTNIGARAKTSSDSKKPEQWSIFKSIEFDENGVVISAVERKKDEE